MADTGFELVTDPAGYRRAADALAAGRGPFAIDTERASAFRYDDRAFLVQIARRDAGIFLIAPEHYREDAERILAPVVSDTEWILHAAPEDLPSLAELGLTPGTLFDTALAGRIAGFDKPNLGAMVEEFCGITLEKSHGREDWSREPLPADWLRYAADDVAYLADLAEAQAEYLDAHGKLGIAEQEFEHIVERNAAGDYEPNHSWEDLKGLSALKHPTSRAIARGFWEERELIAASQDIAPSSVLPHKVIIEVAKQRPASARELAAVHGFPARRKGAVAKWFGVLREVYEHPLIDERSPSPVDPSKPPGKSSWKNRFPESWDVLQAARRTLIELGEEVNIPPEIVLTPATLRAVVWELTGAPTGVGASEKDVQTLLRHHGAREWQVELAAPAIARACAQA